MRLHGSHQLSANMPTDGAEEVGATVENRNAPESQHPGVPALGVHEPPPREIERRYPP